MTAGGTTINNGLTVQNLGMTVNGIFKQTGSVSVSSTTTAVLDIFASNGVFNGELITGRVPPGEIDSNLLNIVSTVPATYLQVSRFCAMSRHVFCMLIESLLNAVTLN